MPGGMEEYKETGAYPDEVLIPLTGKGDYAL